MQIPTKKLKSGFELPVYGLGLWEMGGRWEADDSKDEVEIDAIRYAIEQGVTYFDTAEGYGNGHAEELLAKALKGYDRKKIIISTKVSGHNQGYAGVMKVFESSLKRLQSEYVDLYMIHRFPEKGLSIQETMRAMNELVDKGLVRYIGVSNCTPARFSEAQKYSKHKIVYNQVHYNVEYREVEEYKIPEDAIENDYFLCAWRPLQKGSLGDTQIIKELAEKYKKTPYQVMINWLISQQNVITLSKTSNKAHLVENLGALGWSMTDSDVERIRQEYPDIKKISDAVPLDYEGSDT